MTAIDVTAAAVTAALSIIDGNLREFGDAYPADTTRHDRYPMRAGNVGWTTSFWPGMLWLAYDLTGAEKYREAASGHVGSFAARVAGRVDVDTHDLGFLYTLSCVTAFRRTGNQAAKRAALAAADHLMSRVLEPAGIIQAWGDLRDPAQRGRTIIDSLMNTPLLFWASEQTGEHRYAQAAWRHAAQLRDHILRPDGSTYHTFYWDPAGGSPLRGETEQGHADDSCWARGQAWGIYGFLLNHQHTGDASFLEAARRCADYFLAHLPDDGVPYWDLSLAGVERDSSAAAIAVCGLAQLGAHDAAGRILGSLISDYPSPGNALLRHGVYDKPKGVGVDEGTLWGDYFYLEALVRATRPGWTHPW
ncbi:glycoside hydrolase family 88 protein [Actinoplanes oblitus]|uniref:Glycoside hydrolase family 88 protein n=1 Tax=Actinoplanes oblitus TaxID=3040509 RepID=A0ABY8WKV5_9ACTN|nr:glycoside hydrolase family 88 protein [Actinoplanes oblitus]WIM98531.1 glycoside hydrolase family 88 protein [Actinoplanes oblitus]